MNRIPFTLPMEEIVAFCQRHRIRRLALFGSALGDSFGPDSDVDVLVKFAAGVRPGLFALGGMQMDLSELLGREVDLKTAGFLSPRIRQQIVRGSETIYEG